MAESTLPLNVLMLFLSKYFLLISSTGIKYLSGVDFYFPIAEQFASGVPILSDSS